MTNLLLGDIQMDACERKDSYILNRIYLKYLVGTNYKIKEFPRFYHVDVYNEITDPNGKVIKWNTEIKLANILAKKDYPTFKLKVLKIKDALSVSLGIGLWLVYLDYFTGNAYIYNARSIDWSKVEKRDDYQLIRYVLPELGYDYFPTYFLPKTMAHKVIPFKTFADEYDKGN